MLLKGEVGAPCSMYLILLWKEAGADVLMMVATERNIQRVPVARSRD